MKIHYFNPMKWIIPFIFLTLAGCGGPGPADGTAAAGRETLSEVSSWTALPDNTQTPMPSSTSTRTPASSLSAIAAAAGRRHTCVIVDKNNVKCWGENEDGQLGDGTTVQKSFAVDVLGLDEGITEIAAGYNHTCALTGSGGVRCWGNNAFGQLGDDTQTSRSRPVMVPLPGSIVAVSAGTLHSCAATCREIYCWGIVEYQYLEGEDVVGISFKPYRVDVGNIPADEQIISIGSGFAHDCVLTDQGSVYCWGRNDIGQLGRGPATYADNVPDRVLGITGPVVKLAVGGSHTCVIQDDHMVACWGYNKYGQLGSSHTGEEGQPAKIAGLKYVTDLSAGAYHTCAILSGGGAKCWGDNRYHQLGGEQTALGNIADIAGKFRSIAAGGSHTCALTENGGVECWGNNKFGQLGESAISTKGTPVPTRTKTIIPPKTPDAPTPTPEPSNFVVSIAAGRYHTCVVTESGGVKCWGKNEHGELGNGTNSDSSVPVDVVGLQRGVRAVVAGWGHTCALMDSGGVKCWGYNDNGELGNAFNSNSNIPVDVSGLDGGVISIDAADDHTCVVLAGGNVGCWGYNEYGQLGDGATVDRNVPVYVPGQPVGAHAVAAGWGHTCALLATGGVKCWGNNELGQLGDGSDAENRTKPVYVSGMTYDVSAITADGGHTCALKTNGIVMCWGANKYGQLGDGTGEIRKVPVAVAGLNMKVWKLVAGWNTTCAIGEAGELACWGWNYYGQLGNGIRTTSARPVVAGEMMYGVVDAALGWGHTCVITDTGGVQCFGLNEFGQLGDGTTENGYLPLDVIGLSG